MRCSACRTQVRRSNTFDTHIRKCTGSGYVLQTDFSGNHKQFQMIMKKCKCYNHQEIILVIIETL